jgi:NADPH:quinone reductase-like Zn-dependent oxidoreductase
VVFRPPAGTNEGTDNAHITPSAHAAFRRDDTEQHGLGKTALITGVSGGIGYELALLFARDRYDLVLIARSKDKLKAVADELERNHGTRVRVLPKDLPQPQTVGIRPVFQRDG